MFYEMPDSSQGRLGQIIASFHQILHNFLRTCNEYKESQTTGQASPLRTYYITRNRLLLVRRNSSLPWRYLSYLYLIFIAGTKGVMKDLMTRRNDLAKATLRGIWHFINN